jgi:adenine C2-methylase RlmN of 23S rRNA A2503 and tRNA A37
MMERLQLLDLTSIELERLFTRWGEPAYRVDQVERWLYKRHITDTAQMTSLPTQLTVIRARPCLPWRTGVRLRLS